MTLDQQMGDEPATETTGENLFATRHVSDYYEYVGDLTPEVFDDIVEWCARNKVDDITVQTGLPIYADVAGILRPVTRYPLMPQEMDMVVAHMFGPSAPTQISGGADIDKRYEIWSSENNGETIRFRANATAIRYTTGAGVQITLRALPTAPPSIYELGIEQEIIDAWRPDKGMCLVTGPTGSGKSTLLAAGTRSILEKPNANERIVEYSAPVEYVLDQFQSESAVIGQTDLPSHLDPHNDQKPDFSYAIRNALRRKPTIIQVGECRDQDTMSAALEAARTGHVLYSTLHTTGVAETVRRILAMFGNDGDQHGRAMDLAETMRVLVSQLLIPRRDGGQIGVREYLIMNKKTRSRLLENGRPGEWPSLLRKMMESGEVRGKPMSQSIREVYEDGIIDKEWYDYIAALDEDIG